MNEKSTANKILFVGLNTIDLQFGIDHFPDENSKVKARQKAIHVGGPATNAAVACAHLGSQVDLFTPIGMHSFRDFIYEDLQKHQVNVIDPIQDTVHEPIFASILTNQQNGARTVFSYHPDSLIDKDIELNINLNNYKLVLFDGFYLEFAIPLAQKAQQIGIPCVFDGGSWKPGLETLLESVDIAICSNDFSVPEGSVFEYLRQRGVQQLVITRGENSILYADGTKNCEIHPEPIDALDTLGAGDFFHGAFCHYFNTGSLFTDALERASKVAAHSCLSFGTREWMKG